MSTEPTDTSALFAEFLDDFFAECDEHLAILRRDLLVLETFVEKPRVDRPLLDELFRSFHTVKGLAGMVGVKDAEQLAHQMESYLRALRAEQTSLSTDAMDALIAGVQMLEQVIAARRDRKEIPDTAPVIAQLAAIVPSVLAPIHSPSQAVGKIETRRVGAFALSAEQNARLDTAIASGASVWVINFTPAPALAERGVNVNAIRARLGKIGEVIHAEPSVTAQGGIAFEFLVATSAEASAFVAWRDDGVTCAPFSASATPASITKPASVVEPPPETSVKTTATPSLAPMNIVRVDLARLDELMRIVGELVISRARLEDNLKRLEARVPSADVRALQETNQAIERQLRDLREGVMRVRLVPIGEAFARMQFVLRDLARESQKKVKLELSGQETEIDKFIVERLMDPLLHLVRNAVSHGLELPAERAARGKPSEGKLALRASTAGDLVIIEIEDDGAGIDAQKIAARARALGLIETETALDAAAVLDILCTAGFSTREQADLKSGRGVGMSVVKNTLQELGGTLTLDTQIGRGTRFTIQIPLTLAIVDALIVSVSGQTFAVPQPLVREVILVQPSAVTVMENNEMIYYRGGVLPLVRLARFFGLAEKPDHAFHALVVGSATNPIGITVDHLMGQREIVVRAITDPLAQVPAIAGATELGDGRAVLILDAAALTRVRKNNA